MFAVIFEVNPRPDQWDTYLSYARSLRPELEQIEGFIDNERFSSLRREGWVLSLSIWRDEEAVIHWRTAARHHEIQQKGRSEVFRDYTSQGRGDHCRQPITRRRAAARRAVRRDPGRQARRAVRGGAGGLAAAGGRGDRRRPARGAGSRGAAGVARLGCVRQHLSAGEIHSPHLAARCGSGGLATAQQQRNPLPPRSHYPRLRDV